LVGYPNDPLDVAAVRRDRGTKNGHSSAACTRTTVRVSKRVIPVKGGKRSEGDRRAGGAAPYVGTRRSSTWSESKVVACGSTRHIRGPGQVLRVNGLRHDGLEDGAHRGISPSRGATAPRLDLARRARPRGDLAQSVPYAAAEQEGKELAEKN
jgi:hypothetical protein